MAARSGRDTTLRSAPVRHRRGAPQQSRIGLVLRRLTSRPGTMIASALFTACTVTIALNALAFQTARHPAPLFGEPTSQRSESAVAAPAPLRDIARAPLPPQRDLSLREPATARSPIAPPLPPTPQRIEGDDPIGALIRGGDTRTTASIAPLDPDPQVASVQEALVKLGHGPITVDGLFGPATSAAITQFERQQGLDVTGGLDPVTVRALAVRSGIAIASP